MDKEGTFNNIEPAIIQSSIMSHYLDRKMVDLLIMLLSKRVIYHNSLKSHPTHYGLRTAD